MTINTGFRSGNGKKSNFHRRKCFLKIFFMSVTTLGCKNKCSNLLKNINVKLPLPVRVFRINPLTVNMEKSF